MKKFFKHLKTQTVYEVVAEGRMEATRERAVIYQRLLTGEIWVRPASEFYDGRFMALNDEQARVVMNQMATRESLDMVHRQIDSPEFHNLAEDEKQDALGAALSLRRLNEQLSLQIANF